MPFGTLRIAKPLCVTVTDDNDRQFARETKNNHF